jgi:hypothetical protein
MTAILIVEGIVILLLLILVAGLLKSHAEILRELQRLGGRIGDNGEGPGGVRFTGLGEAPLMELAGSDPSGVERSVSLAHGRGETLLAFLSTGCASCLAFWEALGGKPDMPTGSTRPVIVTKGSEHESPNEVRKLAPPGVPLVMSSEVWESFRVPLTPFFMLIDGAGRVIGEGSALHWDQLLGLLRRALDEAGQGEAAAISPDDPTLYENPVQR